MRRERVPGDMSRWQPWRWVLHDVLGHDVTPHEEHFGLVPKCLRQTEDEQLWLHPGFTVELFKDDPEGYYLNLTSPDPCWFVLWRMEEEPAIADEVMAVPAMVSLSYHDAGRWTLDPQGIASADDEIFRLTTRDGQLGVEKGTVSNEQPALPSDLVFEQSPDQLLNALLPLYLQNQLLRSLQEAAASELASRMTAMNNASDNAKALAKTLTLDYNKARQAAITQEILEVVGGAAAMA